MSSDWKISVIGALGLHVLALFGFEATLRQPPKLPGHTAVEVALVAARVPEPIVKSPPIEVPEPTPPVVERPVEPPPAPTETPERIVETPLPLPQAAPPPPPTAIIPLAPTTSPANVSPSSEPGPDKITVQAQIAEPATPKRHNPKPPYPSAARQRRQEGMVLLRVRITEQGRVAKVEIKQSSGFPLLDESALKTVLRHWRFEPARVGAIPVEDEKDLPVRFQLVE